MKNYFKAFSKVLSKEHASDTTLGSPAGSPGALARRLHTMAMLREGKGFRVPPAEPATRRGYDGRTRGEEKRRRQELANKNEIDRQRAAAERLVSAGMPRKEAFRQFGSLQGAR